MNVIRPQGGAVVCRPMLANWPPARARPWSELVGCPQCGGPCWKLKDEPDPLPANVVAACTACALAVVRGEPADPGGFPPLPFRVDESLACPFCGSRGCVRVYGPGGVLAGRLVASCMSGAGCGRSWSPAR